MTNSTDQTIDNSDLLDETLDDLADLPQSKPFVAGAHIVSVTITRDKKKPSTFLAKFVHKETLELSNPGDTPPNPGDEAIMFIHTKKKDGKTNDFGQGQLKEILKPISEMIGSTKISECLEATRNGLDMTIVSGIKVQKDYTDSLVLSKIEVLS